jgi:hypothetical protein
VPRRRVRTAVFSAILADEALPSLQVVGSIHAVMKDADDRDAVVRDAKVNHVPLDIAAPIPLTM